MKTILPIAISSVKEAKALLKALHVNNEAFHCEDDATDITGQDDQLLFTKAEGDQLNNLMQQIYALEGDFDPCGYLLSLVNPDVSENTQSSREYLADILLLDVQKYGQTIKEILVEYWAHHQRNDFFDIAEMLEEKGEINR